MSVRWCLFLLVVNVVALWPGARGVVLGAESPDAIKAREVLDYDGQQQYE